MFKRLKKTTTKIVQKSFKNMYVFERQQMFVKKGNGNVTEKNHLQILNSTASAVVVADFSYIKSYSRVTRTLKHTYILT